MGSHIRSQLQTITKSSLSSKMLKIAVYIVASLALAQQSYGLSKCYKGSQKSDGEPSLDETDCSTNCVKAVMPHVIHEDKWTATMYCDGSAGSEGLPGCASQKDECAEVDLGRGLAKATVCCCSTDLCNGVGVSGLSGAIAMALVAAIFWGQN